MASVLEELAGHKGALAAVELARLEEYIARRTSVFAASVAMARIRASDRNAAAREPLAAELREILQDWAAQAPSVEHKEEPAGPGASFELDAPGGPGEATPRPKAPGGPLTYTPAGTPARTPAETPARTPARTPAGSRRPSIAGLQDAWGGARRVDAGMPHRCVEGSAAAEVPLTLLGVAIPARMYALREVLEPARCHLVQLATTLLARTGQRLPSVAPLPRRYWSHRDRLLAEQMAQVDFNAVHARSEGTCASKGFAEVAEGILGLFGRASFRTVPLRCLGEGGTDLVALLMDAHHMGIGVAQALSMAARALRTGGWLLVWEHDCRSGVAADVLDAAHVLDQHILGEALHGFEPGEYAAYAELRLAIERCGLKLAAEARVAGTDEVFAIFEKL